MHKPIGIVEAAAMAGTSRKRVHAAMESGELMWKALEGHQATTERWIKSWQRAKANQ